MELSNPHVPHLKTRADALISKNAASVKSIDVGTDEYRLYRNLIKGNKSNKASIRQKNTRKQNKRFLIISPNY